MKEGGGSGSRVRGVVGLGIGVSGALGSVGLVAVGGAGGVLG